MYLSVKVHSTASLYACVCVCWGGGGGGGGGGSESRGVEVAGWHEILRPFQKYVRHISKMGTVGNNDRLCALKHRLRLKRFLHKRGSNPNQQASA